MDDRRKGLGRGLAALLGDEESDPGVPAETGRLRDLPIEQVFPGRAQPRTHFDETALEELAASIRERGVLQPIVVREAGDRRFEIIAGERRWRAAQRAQLHAIPAIVRSFAANEALEVALIENVQRQDLDALDEAAGYRRLIDEFGYTQEQVGRMVGKSRAVVANRLRLFALPDAVKAYLRDGRLTEGHARALLSAPDPVGLAEAIVRDGLSVRQAEDRAAGRSPTKAARPPRAPAQRDADLAALERNLAEALGLKVHIDHRVDGGAVTVRYTGLEQLDALCRLLSRGLGGPTSTDEEPLEPGAAAAELAQLSALPNGQ